MTTTLLHEVTTLGYTVHIRRSPTRFANGRCGGVMSCPQALAADGAVIEHSPGGETQWELTVRAQIAPRRWVQRDESTRQPFSAIHSVVKRTPSAIPSASWPPMNLSIVPPTNGTLTFTVAV